MQPPLPQAQPPQMNRSSFIYGRGMSIGAPQQPLLRLPAGRWLPTGELMRPHQRSTPEQLIACQELFQRQNEGPQKTFEHPQHWGPKVGARVPQITLAADVGAYTGGGGGAGRNITYINSPYSPVATQPNSGQQLQQSQQNQQQLRPQPPPLPPTHNPHNTGGGSQSLPPHSQHHPHPHSALAQQSHQVITTGGAISVSGLGSSVQQVNPGVGPPGTNPAQQVQQHDLNAQGIPQGSSQQIQVPGVVNISGTTHQIMYSSNQNAQQQGHQQQGHQQQPNHQVQQQYYAHPQGAAQMQGGQRQMITHQHMQVPNYQFVQANMIPPMMHTSNATQIYQHVNYATLSQARPGATTQYQQMPAPGQQYHTMSQFHQLQAPIYYPPQPQMKSPLAHVAPPPQRERRAIPIIDPLTRESILDSPSASNSKQSQPDSPIQTRDSSGVNTPALHGPLSSTTKSIIQAQFALQVTQAVTGIDKNKESVNDSGLSTIESEVTSHNMDNINSEVRENFSSVSNNSVDNSSKDTDINKIARNVPDHNVSKPHQPKVSSFQPTQPLPSTVATQQSQPTSQPQRQNKQARVGSSTVATVSSQPQAVAPPQPQSVKGSGTLQQSKQTSQNMQSKPSNQPQQKSPGNQVPLTGKGSPAGSQHGAQQSKNQSSQSQGAQKLSQQPQHQSKIVSSEQQLPKMMQGDEQPQNQKLSSVEQQQVKVTSAEHTKVFPDEKILPKDSEFQQQSTSSEQPLENELLKPKVPVDRLPSNISADEHLQLKSLAESPQMKSFAKPQQQKASTDTMELKLSAEQQSKNFDEHNLVKVEHQPKVPNEQQLQSKVEPQFPNVNNQLSSHIGQSYEMRSNMTGTESSLSTSLACVDDMETSPIPVIPVYNKSALPQQISLLEQVVPAKGFTPMNGPQPNCGMQIPSTKPHGDQPTHQAGAPVKLADPKQSLPADQSVQYQRGQKNIPLNKSTAPVNVGRTDLPGEVSLPTGKRGKEKPVEEKKDLEVKEIIKEELPSMPNDHFTPAWVRGPPPHAAASRPVLPDGAQSSVDTVCENLKSLKIVSSDHVSSTEDFCEQSTKTSHIPKSDSEFSSNTPVNNLSKGDNAMPPSSLVATRSPESDRKIEPSPIINNIDESKNIENYDDGAHKKGKYPKKISNSGYCIDETSLDMKNVNESVACEKVAFDIFPKYWYNSMGKPLPNSPPSAAKAEELLKSLKILSSNDNSFSEDNDVQVKKGDCFVNESGKKVSQPSKKINSTEPAPIQNAVPNVMAPPKVESGKRQYDRDFLIGLQQNPLSLMRPDSLPNLEVVLDGPHQKSYEYKQPKLMQDFTPLFMQNANRNRNNNNFMQQKVIGRNSQQGRRPVQKIIDIKLSSSSEVKLKTTENAWKPSNKDKPTKDEADGSNSKHEELLKRTRGILNKLTPDNFEKLSVKVKDLPIETYFDLDGIIVLVFEKAVDEQAFSTTYAQLCQVLSTMTVKLEENKDPKEGKEAKFRNLMINRCQKEFEKDNSKNLKIVEMAKQREECTNADEKTELKILIDFEETRLRKRSVGNIRFIGELYKLKMLTSPIMMRIIEGLLKKRDEESLECLCKLLTTIGKILESSARLSHNALEDFNNKFHEMQTIIEDKKSNTSSRVRFLLMDVVDLRKNNWVPRREDSKPKTKAEVHADIRKEEEMQQQQLHLMSNSNTPRRDDSQRKNRGGGRDNNNRMQNEEGWNMVGASSGRRVPLDTSRLKNTFSRNPTPDNPVEFRTPNFGVWSQGSSGGSGGSKEQSSETLANRYALLDTAPSLDLRRTPNTNIARLGPGGGSTYHRHSNFGSKSMPPPSEKENALSTVKMLVHPGDRSKSNSRSSSRDNSRSRNVVPSLPEMVKDPALGAKYARAIIDEYMNAKDIKDAKICVTEKFPPCNMSMFIYEILNWSTDRDLEKRTLTGRLVHELVKSKIASFEHLKDGAKEVFELIDDLRIDIPAVDRHIGEVLAYLLMDNVCLIGDIYTIIQPAGSCTASIMAEVVLAASKLLGETKTRELWTLSNLRWDNLVPKAEEDPNDIDITTEEKARKREESITEFLKRHKLEFTATENLTVKPIHFQPSRVREDLLNVLKRNPSSDEIFGWIEANVGDNSSDPLFVRALTQALIESLMTTSSDGSTLVIGEDFETRIKDEATILKKYVGNKEDLEMKVILGIQQLSAENQHPPGFTEKCFNALYDVEVLSDESFAEWEKNDDPDEQLGKGVCLSSVRNFLKWLRETEVEGDEAKQVTLPK